MLRDLLHVGNTYLKDEDWMRAECEFSNGLDICQDVREKNVHLHEDLLESLYVGRAAAYHGMVRNLTCDLFQPLNETLPFVRIDDWYWSNIGKNSHSNTAGGNTLLTVL